MLGEIFYWNVGVQDLSMLGKEICLDVVIECFDFDHWYRFEMTLLKFL